MYQIELICKNTVMYCSTDQYEFYGPDINELKYLGVYTQVTVELQPGDELRIYDSEGLSVEYICTEEN